MGQGGNSLPLQGSAISDLISKSEGACILSPHTAPLTSFKSTLGTKNKHGLELVLTLTLNPNSVIIVNKNEN